MIGLYAQNQNTQNELCQQLQDVGIEAYQHTHRYSLVVWLSDEKPPQNVFVILPRQITLPLSLSEWRLVLQKSSHTTISYQNAYFLIETDKRLLTHLKTQQQISLTEKENDLFQFLIQEPTHSATRETLLQTVWKYNSTVQTHTLESHLYTLKQKIGQDAENLLQYKNGRVNLF